MFERKTGLDIRNTLSTNGGVIDAITLSFSCPPIPGLFAQSWHFSYTFEIAKYAEHEIFKLVRLALLVLVYLTLIQVIVVTLRQY